MRRSVRRGPVLRSAVLVVAVVAGCAPSPDPSPPDQSPPDPSAPVSVTATAAPPVSPDQHASPTVHTVTTAELGVTWRPGCPVGPDLLRRIELDFLGFDGRLQRGALVVHADLVEEVIRIFADLLALRYPIERMQTVDRYPGAEDELSMRDNNTSAFNCRPLPGGSNWSQHAYGRAIDVNPLINPYITAAGDLEPATAAA
jgi:hypothetical protein